jgi:hypothetical protein
LQHLSGNLAILIFLHKHETNLKFEWRPLNFHPYLACFSVSSQEQTDICRGVTNHEIKLPRFYKMERGRGPIVLKKIKLPHQTPTAHVVVKEMK